MSVIEDDIDALQRSDADQSVEISVLSQRLTDGLFSHSVRITAAHDDALSAHDTAAEALSRIYSVGLGAQTDLSSEIQKVRDEQDNAVAIAVAAMAEQLRSEFSSTVSGSIPDVEVSLASALQTLNARANELGMQDITDLLTLLLNTRLPELTNNLDNLSALLATTSTNVDEALSGLPYSSVVEGLDATITTTVNAVLPLGYSILRLPAAAWTVNSATARRDDKVPPSAGNFIANDAILGECYAFPAGNRTIGQSYPMSFDPEKVYRIATRVRVVDNGIDDAGVAFKVGATTWGAGDILVQQNVETAEALVLREVDGDITFYSYVTGNSAYISRLGNRNPLDLTGSALGLQAFFHVRANADDVTSGRALVSLLEIKDVTEAYAETSAVFDEFDTTPPNKPGKPDLSSYFEGTTAKLLIDWPDSGEENLHYTVEVTENGGNPVSYPTTLTRHVLSVVPGFTYTARVKAFDKQRNASVWSDTASHQVLVDTIPPAAPEGLSADPGFGSIWLSWTDNTESDLSHYEIYENTDNTAPLFETQGQFSSASSTFLRSGIPPSTTRHYWVRAIDTSDNKSGWSISVSAQTPVGQAFTTEDLRGAVDATSFANGIEPIKIVEGDTLPTEKLTSTILFQDKLYRWTGSKYESSVDARDILGQLERGQLGIAAVGADQIAAGAVATKQLAVVDFENLLGGGNFEAYFDLTDPAYSTGTATNPKVGRFLRLRGPGPNIGASSKIVVTPGEEFYLSFVAFCDAEWNGDSGGSKVRIGDQDGNFINALPYSADRLTTAWVLHETSFVVPDNVNALSVALWNNATAGNCYLSALTLRRKGNGKLLVDGTIAGRHLVTDTAVITDTAQIANAIIDDAKVKDLSAAKLKAGTALASTLTVSGTALSTIRSQANDPAARINAASTQIDPGRILISGATTLFNWIKGGDETRMDGGQISANSVRANSLEIGSRNVTLTGIEFEHNSPSTNQVSWTAGNIRYINDAGNSSVVNIPAGNRTWNSNVLYIYWAKDSGAFSSTSSTATAFSANNLIVATYQGGKKLDADYGRTIVDGSSVKTGTLISTSVDTDSFNAAGVSVFGDELRSSNFTPDSDVGWGIYHGGFAKFNGPVISRQLVSDSGTLNVTGRSTNSTADPKIIMTYWLYSTGVSITAWEGAKETYICEAGFFATMSTDDSANAYWGVRAIVMPLTRFSGNQSLRIKFEVMGQKITGYSDGQIKWRLYKVT